LYEDRIASMAPVIWRRGRGRQNGRRAPAGDARALSFAIEGALRRAPEETRAQCELARAFVVEHFSQATIMARYLAAYELVLGRALEPVRDEPLSVSG